MEDVDTMYPPQTWGFNLPQVPTTRGWMQSYPALKVRQLVLL